MIHVTTPALASTLIHLGLSDASIQLANRTIALIKLDPVACPFHRSLEDQLLSLIEDCEMQRMGLGSLDAIIASAAVLTATLNRLAELYVFHGVNDRAARVLNLSRAISDSLAWA